MDCTPFSGTLSPQVFTSPICIELIDTFPVGQALRRVPIVYFNNPDFV